MDDDRDYWERIHAGKSVADVSWWQEPEALWLDLIDDLGVAADAPLVDVGSGSSLLMEALLDGGRTHLTALDVSATALHRVAERLADRASAVRMVECDVRAFDGAGGIAVWHDRAVFHFLTEEADRAAYRAAMRRSLAPGAWIVAASFAPDGPAACSGLPVQRYTPELLAAALGAAPDEVVRAERRVHETPWGALQPFSVVVVRTGS